jgi:hypothetical protein
METFRFTPVEDFFSEETHSQYVAGLSYTVGPHDSVLREAALRWLAEGKIRQSGARSTMRGGDA